MTNEIPCTPSVADPDPETGAFLTPESGMGKKSGSGSRIWDEQPRSYFLELRNHFFGLKYLNSLMRIRDGKNSDPGSGMEKSRIRDKHPRSATLCTSLFNCAQTVSLQTIAVASEALGMSQYR
jgi:hypothetical protein